MVQYKMILTDMSNLAISAVQSAMAGGRKEDVVLNETTLRYIIIKRLYEVHKKIGKHHELVLCFDSKNYWRKDYYWCYKGNRKKNESDFPWKEFYRLYNDFKVEFPLYFNFKCLEVDRVEADDIIFCISEYEKGKNVIIASSDTDDLQILEKYAEAAQYSFKKNAFITCADYKYSLLDHIICGDSTDAVANILSDVDTYVVAGKRSETMTKQRLAKLKFIIPEENKERFEQNKKVVDMSQIPSEYRERIIDAYLAEKPKRIGKPLNYCMKYNLGNLLKHIS